MPVGVPKVPFRNPGEEDATWIELNRLYRERLLFLGQEVKEEISNTIVGLMVYLSIEDQTRDLYLFINSPGGWVISGIAIFDTMQFVTPNVHTICMGIAASMASFILVGGEITKRLAFPHAWRIMIHQPASSFYDGRSGDFFRETRQIVKLRETLTKVYVQRTGMPLWVVAQDMERDIFMSATEAQAYGIVDLVGADPEDFEDFLL
uniref:ATP-dependent Clp protease proteolytic subunit n=4 Tax=Wurfbainia TaxID=2135801 RepID=A0A5C0ANK1_9LILI|nr:clp protease proteolytic subunit [Wurfbainia villosa]YP_009693982.1 clp protease proteolytic subunit [Wurfbainia villosa var. xanthioides]YP_009694887.1 clp protease proteolytic subunit [Wurfbainia longiligularis]YP_010155365.1 clp protease proteolytic subunit [Wurfbainia neoaurantiaca]QEI03819.1 clp protease proteolytic subunit [Wurfbainia villosa]QEI03906.1 clp protease proteolytic subunit [Wurfbainia villosa]QEI03993.1 clp protease proteolytic subunit [Wurfbainia villosa var. xanthioide